MIRDFLLSRAALPASSRISAQNDGSIVGPAAKSSCMLSTLGCINALSNIYCKSNIIAFAIFGNNF